MELRFVKQLKEAESAAQAETLIAEGWVLISIIATTRPNGQSYPCYILGKGVAGQATSQPLRV